LLLDNDHLHLGWSNEQFPVVNPAVANAGAPDACFADRAAFSVERAALPLFGFPNYGSMLIGTADPFVQGPMSDYPIKQHTFATMQAR
jgi:hypothetical protein